MTQYREPKHDIHPLIIDRWCSRSFDYIEIPQEELFSLFEAACWTHSAMNAQPWKFMVAVSELDRETINSFLFDGNLTWCKNASVYALLYSDKYYENGNLNRTHGFDAGAASILLTLEAENQCLVTYMMGGFDEQKSRDVLQMSNQYELHDFIAIGYHGAKNKLTEGLQMREQPIERNPIESFVKIGL